MELQIIVLIKDRIKDQSFYYFSTAGGDILDKKVDVKTIDNSFI